MRVVTLIPLSKRAKQIVKQHGERWEVIRQQMTVLFTDEPGPWSFMQPLSEERAPANDVRSAREDSASRWIHEYRDSDFKVTP